MKKKILDLNKMVDFFGYLHSRWQDEKEYEDFEEYKKALVKNFKVDVSSFTKRPFKVIFKSDGVSRYMKIQNKQIIWGRMGKNEKEKPI